MKSRHLITGILALALLAFSAVGMAAGKDASAPSVTVQHIRNATSKFTSGDTTFLIDPMLAEVGAYEGFPDTYRSWLRNPLTPLPMPVKDVLADVDAVILTHLHLDHWDPAAQKAIPKDIPLYVQNEEDAKIVRGQGFTNVRVMKQSDEFGGVKIERTKTQHGTDAMYADRALGKLLGDVMGLVFIAPDGKKTWYAADTIWFKGVDDALAQHNPDIIVLNAGGAALSGDQFKDNPDIIMGKEDVLKMTQKMPNSKVIAVHMDAINHMTVDRKDLSEYLRENGAREKVMIPFDGEKMAFK